MTTLVSSTSRRCKAEEGVDLEKLDLWRFLCGLDAAEALAWDRSPWCIVGEGAGPWVPVMAMEGTRSDKRGCTLEKGVSTPATLGCTLEMAVNKPVSAGYTAVMAVGAVVSPV